jgi:tetratricopeptide (TPR) repeat protein
LRRLELDRTNIGAAFAFAIAADRRELAVRIAVASRRFWHSHGHLVEGLAALNAALDVMPEADHEARGKLVNGAGILAAQQGDYEAARSLFKRAADLGRQFRSRKQLGNALGNLARIAMIEGDYTQAEELLEQALKDDPHDEYVATLVLECLSEVALARNDLDRALLLAQECCSLARKAGSASMMGNAALALGTALLERAELTEAAVVLHESLGLKVEIAERPGLAECLEVVGGFCAASGDGETAAMLLGAASSVRASVGAARSPDLDAGYRRYVARAHHETVGAAFDRAFAKGTALSTAEAVAVALDAVSTDDRAAAVPS